MAEYPEILQLSRQMDSFNFRSGYYENRSGTDLPDPGLFLTCYTFSAALLIFLHCEGKVDKVE